MSEETDIKEIAFDFKYWDDEVSRLETSLVHAKRMRSKHREDLLEAVTRYDLD